MTRQDAPPVATPVSPFEELLAELRGQLEGSDWIDLVAEIPDPDDEAAIGIAFVGPHNAGKSSLISALTGDLTIRRSAKPETSDVERYPWRDGIDLIDLPGWFSGFTAHDDHAGEILRRNADLVAFVMTVELGDERVVEAIEEVLGELGFAQRAVVVVNKAQSEDSDVDVVLEEIERRLGRFDGVPVVMTDAQSYLDTISGEFGLDAETIEILAAGSGVGAFAEALGAMAVQHHDTARRQARAMQAARVAQQALARLVPDQDEEAAAASLDQLQAALDRARARLCDLAGSHLTRLESAVALIAERELAVGELSEAALQQAWDEAHAPVEQLSQDAHQVVADLAVDFGGVLNTLAFAADRTERPDRSAADGSRQTDPLSRRLLGAMGIDLSKASNVLSKAADKVARDGSRQGSIAYDAVRKLQPRKKFAPHGRLKDAERFRRGAKVASKANVVTPAVEEAWNWWREIRDSRAAEKAQAALRKHWADLASEEREHVEGAFEDWASQELTPFQSMLAEGRVPLDDAAAARESKRQQLMRLHDGLSSVAASSAEAQDS